MRSDPVPTDDSCAVQNTAAKSKIETLIVILLRTAILVWREKKSPQKSQPCPFPKDLTIYGHAQELSELPDYLCNLSFLPVSILGLNRPALSRIAAGDA